MAMDLSCIVFVQLHIPCRILGSLHVLTQRQRPVYNYTTYVTLEVELGLRKVLFGTPVPPWLFGCSSTCPSWARAWRNQMAYHLATRLPVEVPQKTMMAIEAQVCWMSCKH